MNLHLIYNTSFLSDHLIFLKDYISGAGILSGCLKRTHVRGRWPAKDLKKNIAAPILGLGILPNSSIGVVFMRERAALTPAQAKRQTRQKTYYQSHRDEIRQQQREYYRSIDKAVHAARVREYRRKNHDAYLAYRREYRAKNRERFAEYNRRAREKRKAQKAESQKERRIAAAEQTASRTYYERNRYELCRRRLGEECFRAMERVKAVCPERIERYLKQWPFETYADRRIKSQLRWWRIYPQHHLYDDCYDAGMLAYFYSIHRCAMMEYQHVHQYIAKMVRIFVICALNVGREAENLCRENDLRLCHMDHDVFDA